MTRHQNVRKFLTTLVAVSGLACATEPDGYGPPALLQLFKGPAGSQESGVPFNRAAVIQIADLHDNPVPLRRIRITASIESGEGTLGGTTTVATAEAGSSIFEDLVITGPAGENVLTFTVPGLISARTTIILSPSPQQLVMVSGDGQAGIPGLPLQAPLRVRAIGLDQEPLPGARIRWSIIEGEGTLEPVESSTDHSGEAETRVNLGATPGPVVVRASVSGLPPLNFSLVALGLCQSKHTPNIPKGVAVHGALEPRDCVFHAGQFYDLYSFVLTSQDAVLVSVNSNAFDPSLSLFTFVDQRERGTRTSTLDARSEATLKAILPPGMFAVAASAVDVGALGPYTLQLSATSPSAESCEAVFVVSGITTEQQLTPGDCVDDLGKFYGDAFRLWLWHGEQVVLTQSSEFPPLIQLYRASGELVDQSAGSGPGAVSLSFAADAAGLYTVVATSARMFAWGPYTLSVSQQYTDLIARKSLLGRAGHPAPITPRFGRPHSGTQPALIPPLSQP